MPKSLLSHFWGAVRAIAGGAGSWEAPGQQRGLAGTHEAEPGIDFPLIPCNHILQRLLSYISIPHLRL